MNDCITFYTKVNLEQQNQLDYLFSDLFCGTAHKFKEEKQNENKEEDTKAYKNASLPVWERFFLFHIESIENIIDVYTLWLWLKINSNEAQHTHSKQQQQKSQNDKRTNGTRKKPTGKKNIETNFPFDAISAKN